MNKFVLRQSFLLLLTATIWGVAFVAQSVGMEYVEPFTFNAVRNIIGGIVLLPFIWLMNKKEDKQILRQKCEVRKKEKNTLIIGGIACGFFLCVAGNLQQIGIQYTSVGKAGFITAMYIVLVPIFSIFLKKKAGIQVWISVVVAVCGLYLLCMTGGLSFEMGDILVLLCAVVFSFHILVVDYFSPLVSGVKLACLQFFVCGILSGICMFLFETPTLSYILMAWKPILYAGALSCGVGYTLQIVGQRGMNPTVASLIMSLESVISVIAGFFLLNQTLSIRELGGCFLMFVAIVLAQLPGKKKTLESEIL